MAVFSCLLPVSCWLLTIFATRTRSARAKSSSGSASITLTILSFCRKLPNWTIHLTARGKTNQHFSFTIKHPGLNNLPRTLPLQGAFVVHLRGHILSYIGKAHLTC